MQRQGSRRDLDDDEDVGFPHTLNGVLNQVTHRMQVLVALKKVLGRRQPITPTIVSGHCDLECCLYHEMV